MEEGLETCGRTQGTAAQGREGLREPFLGRCVHLGTERAGHGDILSDRHSDMEKLPELPGEWEQSHGIQP